MPFISVSYVSINVNNILLGNMSVCICNIKFIGLMRTKTKNYRLKIN